MTIARVLVIAGSDSGGGAGIQADIKTITMLGGHAMTAITAITAQNTLGVQAAMPVPTAMVMAQIESVLSDIGVDAVKIGMIGSAETAHAVADRLGRLDVPIVFDPVMIATSGSMLADEATIAAFERLIGIATVTTPNQDELVVLSGVADRDDLGVFEAATGLAERYCTAILATGTVIFGGIAHKITDAGPSGQRPTEKFLYDRLFSTDPETGFAEWEWSDERIDTDHTHGTGCTLASGIAIGLGQGLTLPDAIERARRFVRAALAHPAGLGRGQGPMGHNLGIVPFDEVTR